MEEEIKIYIEDDPLDLTFPNEPPKEPLPGTTAENDILVGSGIGTWIVKTIAQFKIILGLKSAAYTESSAYLPSNTSIPSKTSDLSNDSGFITSSSVPTALSQLSTDSENQRVSSTEKSTWNTKSKVTQVSSLTLLSASWTTGATYKQYELSHSSILATSIVDVIPDNADNAVVSIAQILPATVSAEGKVTIYAINTPTGNIGVTINIIN